MSLSGKGAQKVCDSKLNRKKEQVGWRTQVVCTWAGILACTQPPRCPTDGRPAHRASSVSQGPFERLEGIDLILTRTCVVGPRIMPLVQVQERRLQKKSKECVQSLGGLRGQSHPTQKAGWKDRGRRALLPPNGRIYSGRGFTRKFQSIR